MNIEEYIRKNRNRMDVENPDEDYIWAGVSHSMSKKRRNKRFFILKIAAAAIIIIAFSFITLELISIRNNQQLILSNIDPELARQEAQFQKQIKSYYKVLKTKDYDQSEMATNYSELQMIDQLINEYSKDLDKHGPNPRLLNSLMDLYQKKIKILDRMLNEIEKNENYENNTTHI